MALRFFRLRLCLALALISAAVIAYQLALMQILSLVQWHHFAYLIIAVALLGFGAAGTLLSLLRVCLMANFALVLPLVLFLSGAAMALMPGIAQCTPVRFDSLLLFTDIRHLFKLLAACGFYFFPFFLAALAIGMIFVDAARDIGRLYFWNLTGSGAGGAAMTGLLWLFPPPALPALAALAAVAAAALVLPEGLQGPVRYGNPAGSGDAQSEQGRDSPGIQGGAPGDLPQLQRRGMLITVAVLSGLSAVFFLVRPPAPVLSDYKTLSRALQVGEAKIVHERESPYGFMQVLSSPSLRYVPGLSLVYPGRIPVTKAVFNNGDWFGAVVPWPGEARESFLDFTTGALPFAIGTWERVLLLDAGTGIHVSQAIDRGAHRVTVVEPHPVALSLLRQELAGETGNLFRNPSVTFCNLAARTFLHMDRSRYDLVLLPTLGAFGGASGLQAVREQYLLTGESFRQIWGKLNPQGVMSVTLWMDYPLRGPLRILAMLVEGLEREGVVNIRDHLAAVRGWGTVTFMVKKTPLNAADVEKIRHFCGRLLFDPALLPGLREAERARFNGLQDGGFFRYLDALLSPSRTGFYADYAFDVRPATDNRPYFFQFLRLKSVSHLTGIYGIRSFPFLEAGYLIVLLTLLLVTVAAVILILLPLHFLPRRGRQRMGVLLYFSGLGIGYMFVEIVLIQRFLLYFGNPIDAAATVISGMLVWSGIGSLLSARWVGKRGHALCVFGLIALFILADCLFLMPVLQATLSLPPALKIMLSLLLIAPVSLVMGVPFPLGIRLLSGTADHEIPWAWGVNGCLSVVGAVLATVIAVEAGFSQVMILAAAAYGMTLLGGWTALFRTDAFRSISS